MQLNGEGYIIVFAFSKSSYGNIHKQVVNIPTAEST